MNDDLDEFQINAQFMDLLKQNLSARSIQKVSEFAYTNKLFHETLFEDIMTMLTDCQPTKRLGFFYLIDSLCKLSEKYQFDGYLKASLFRLDDIINAVLDIQRTNGKFSKKPDKYGLSYITSVKKVLTVWKTKKWLNEFDWNNNINMLDMLLKLNPQPLSKEAIFRRMEEDRDRQKRQREDSWLASSNEFQNAWTKCQSLTKQDFELFGEFTRKFESC